MKKQEEVAGSSKTAVLTNYTVLRPGKPQSSYSLSQISYTFSQNYIIYILLLHYVDPIQVHIHSSTPECYLGRLHGTKSDEKVLYGYWEAMFQRKSEGAVFAVITVHLVLGGCSNLAGNLR